MTAKKYLENRIILDNLRNYIYDLSFLPKYETLLSFVDSLNSEAMCETQNSTKKNDFLISFEVEDMIEQTFLPKHEVLWNFPRGEKSERIYAIQEFFNIKNGIVISFDVGDTLNEGFDASMRMLVTLHLKNQKYELTRIKMAFCQDKGGKVPREYIEYDVHFLNSLVSYVKSIDDPEYYSEDDSCFYEKAYYVNGELFCSETVYKRAFSNREDVISRKYLKYQMKPFELYFKQNYLSRKREIISEGFSYPYTDYISRNRFEKDYKNTKGYVRNLIKDNE